MLFPTREPVDVTSPTSIAHLMSLTAAEAAASEGLDYDGPGESLEDLLARSQHYVRDFGILGGLAAAYINQRAVALAAMDGLDFGELELGTQSAYEHLALNHFAADMAKSLAESDGDDLELDEDHFLSHRN